MVKNNIAWADLLRVVACLMVVIAHCCDPFVGQLDSNYDDFLSGAVWGSMVRSCVPLFIMISGVLLLPVKTDMGLFYRKRLTRVIFPLIVWSVILPVVSYFYLSSGIITFNPNIDISSYTQDTMMSKIWLLFFNFNYDTTPFWYIYMLVGVYLVLPIVSAWLTQASKKDIKRVLWLWVASTTLLYLQLMAQTCGYHGIGIFGVCEWNPYGTFYYMSGFLGYVVLAYYLVRYPLNWSWTKTLSVAIPLWSLGYAITLAGFLLTQKYYPGNYPRLEIVWFFCGVNVLMMTYSVFIVMQKIKISSSRLLSSLAGLTFGIYLCHFFVVQVCYDVIYPYIDIAPVLQIPLIAVASFVLSAFVVWIISKLPLRKYTIG